MKSNMLCGFIDFYFFICLSFIQGGQVKTVVSPVKKGSTLIAMKNSINNTKTYTVYNMNTQTMW